MIRSGLTGAPFVFTSNDQDHATAVLDPPLPNARKPPPRVHPVVLFFSCFYTIKSQDMAQATASTAGSTAVHLLPLTRDKTQSRIPTPAPIRPLILARSPARTNTSAFCLASSRTSGVAVAALATVCTASACLCFATISAAIETPRRRHAMTYSAFISLKQSPLLAPGLHSSRVLAAPVDGLVRCIPVSRARETFAMLYSTERWLLALMRTRV